MFFQGTRSRNWRTRFGPILRTGESSQVTPENKKELDAFKSSVTESDDYVDNRVRSYGIQNVFGGDEKAYTDFLESQRTGLGGQLSGGLNALRNLSITNAIFGGGKKPQLTRLVTICSAYLVTLLALRLVFLRAV